MPEYVGCALRSRVRSEPLGGTASQVTRWILVEQPGPWGADALHESRLPPQVAAGLGRAATELGARPLLLRRPLAGRDPDTRSTVPAIAGPTRRSAFFVDGAAPDRRVVRVEFEQPRELLECDIAGFFRGGPLGIPVEEPLVLVCTNGRHDACCALEGRPVALAAAAVAPAPVWECSHVGGDRFAGNVVVLPHGIYYGRVTVAAVPELMGRLAQGRLSLSHYRGRSDLPFAVQAAEILLRGFRDIDRLGAVEPIGAAAADGGAIRARFAVDDELWDVTVAVNRDPEPRLLTCQAERRSHPPRYDLVEMHPLRARSADRT